MTIKNSITVDYCGQQTTLPIGTPIEKVRHKYHDGIRELFAVPVRVLIQLTGNTHDPKYRYCFVPAESVTHEKKQ